MIIGYCAKLRMIVASASDGTWCMSMRIEAPCLDSTCTMQLPIAEGVTVGSHSRNVVLAEAGLDVTASLALGPGRVALTGLPASVASA